MIIIVGLVILVAAVANGASAHAQPLHGARLPRDRLRRPLFLYGIVAVAIALLGLSLALASARRTARRGRAARRGLRQSRRQPPS
jgi:F0F1-type ATP synthase membrane subunit c/vacuolar-type H+-ATPase subunit K